MIFPLNPYACSGIPINHHPGAFGFKRPWNFHPGVDLYTKDGEAVYTIEDGVVVSKGIFTGPEVGHNWWETTWYIMIKGKTGVFNYGEIYNSPFQVGCEVIEGQTIGNVKRVLFEHKYRPDIPGHSCSMLHLELYKGDALEPVEWLDARPELLLDPTPFIIPPYLNTGWKSNFQSQGLL